MPTRSIPWPRILTEGVAIVVSILLAFGIQAWWEGRQEQLQERRALSALARDFEAAADDLEQEVLVMDSVRRAAETVLAWTGPSADARYADSLATIFPAITRLPGFQPPMGTLDALLGSGNLSLIQNDSLRAALASFPSRLEAMLRTESFGADSEFGDFMPFLIRRIPLRRFGRSGDGNTLFDSDVAGLLQSVEFENHLQQRLTNVGFLQDHARRMRDFIAQVRAMLDAELAS